MSITINYALQLEEFKDFKIIAGSTGLNNTINKVGILDYEMKGMIEENFGEGEFVLSTLLVIKDRIEELYEIVERLISAGVAGLAIKNIYFDSLPHEVMELANRNSFPIFIFSTVYFEDIITGVMKAVEENEALELKIDNILYSDLNNVTIKRIAYEINRSFKDKNIVVFCKEKNNEGLRKAKKFMALENNKYFSDFNKIIPYKEGYLIINTFENIEFKKAKNIILKRLEILDFNRNEYIIGVSNLHDKLDELNFSIKESIYALRHSMIYEKSITFFNEMGTNKILMPLMENKWILKYYDEIITPLVIYDSKNNTELLKTAILYIENNGDIKATSKELFQHSNTTRYRIDKIYKILNENGNIKHFYEELAIAIRIHRLIDESL